MSDLPSGWARVLSFLALLVPLRAVAVSTTTRRGVRDAIEAGLGRGPGR